MTSPDSFSVSLQSSPSSSLGTGHTHFHLCAQICCIHVLASAPGRSSVVENISRLPESDNMDYSHYRLTMARSLGFNRNISIARYSDSSSARAEHTQTELNVTKAATRNVFLPYLCWCGRTKTQVSVLLFWKLHVYWMRLNSTHTYCYKYNSRSLGTVGDLNRIFF